MIIITRNKLFKVVRFIYNIVKKFFLDIFNQQCMLAMLNYIEVELTEPNEGNITKFLFLAII